MGMAHVPEDRHKSGMIANFTIYENMVLNTYYEDRFSVGPEHQVAEGAGNRCAICRGF